LLGLLGSPFLGGWFTKFISLTHEVAASPDYLMMALSTAAALAGIGLAWALYHEDIPEERFGRTLFYFFNFARRKFFLDEIYDFVFVMPTLRLAGSAGWFDHVVLDGAVNGIGPLAVYSGQRAARFDSVVVGGAYDSVINSLKTLGEATRRLNTGSLPRYLAYIIGGFIVLAVIVYLVFVLF
jgi:NADH-quinone oxidoreductase subunit L